LLVSKGKGRPVKARLGWTNWGSPSVAAKHEVPFFSLFVVLRFDVAVEQKWSRNCCCAWLAA